MLRVETHLKQLRDESMVGKSAREGGRKVADFQVDFVDIRAVKEQHVENVEITRPDRHGDAFQGV